MNCPKQMISAMQRRRRLISIGVLCMVLAPPAVGPIRAQDSGPPDLQMLLNLDLFRPQAQQGGGEGPAPNSSSSTLDQIRTLSALGFLGNSHRLNPMLGGGAGGRQDSFAPPLSQENPE
jgi:hypothetical protein